MTARSSVQTAHMGLESIADDVVSLGDGQYRAILEVHGIHFALLGEADQEAILVGFAAFLNGLAFPIQVVVRVVPLDLDSAIADLERQASRELPDRLAALARDHMTFLHRLSRQRTLLERRCYVVLGADTVGSRRPSGWSFRPRVSLADTATARNQLTVRCDEVARGLGRCNLLVRRLTSAQLAHLFYTSWCPELSKVQRLRANLADATRLVVGTSRPTERSTP